MPDGELLAIVRKRDVGILSHTPQAVLESAAKHFLSGETLSYLGRKMSVYGAILQGVARLARLPAEPSTVAKRRWKVVRWCEEHEGKAQLTARDFGYSPDTISRWV